MMGKVYIQETPFEEILRSAYETLTKETTGCLFGESDEKRNKMLWIVESAHPMQNVERDSKNVFFKEGIERAYFSLLNERIGGYHSHPEKEYFRSSLRMSNADKRFLVKSDNNIETIISIFPVKRTVKLKEDSLVIKGYIIEKDKIYSVKISSFYFEDRRLKRAEISVPRKVLKLIM